MYLGITTILISVFLLAHSRGALLVFLLIYIITFILVPLRDKIIFLTFSAIAATPSVYVLMKANEIMVASYQANILQQNTIIPNGGWATMLVAAAIAAIAAFIYTMIILHFKKDLKKYRVLQIATIVVGILIIFIGINIISDKVSQDIGSLENIINRLEAFNNIQDNSSAASRIVFYNDSIKIYKNFPILGAGGGAWQALFETYQSYSYWSRQAHTYYLQLAIEAGTLGLIALALILISFLLISTCLYMRYKNNRNQYIIIAAIVGCLMLMSHSFIDFNMSLSSYAMIVWVLFACIFSKNWLSYENQSNNNANSLIERGKNNKLISLLNKDIFLGKRSLFY
ncbi:hypothetical protein N752_30255 [Desulforamulus aquiferis]|nr:O-antigen ligase family protein [Desulforamulus aquiferis]RYD01281.1 hypothetical protein N752_30255 [Desulforamulus aquiferis]